MLTEEERNMAWVKGQDLFLVLGSLKRAQALAQEVGEHGIVERLDPLIEDLEDRRRALRGIIVG